MGGVTHDDSRPLGEWLQQRRQERDISLEQAEADTRIRLRYLEALEAEDIEALPDPVVGRGFLRNYSAYLGLDVDNANRRYSALVGTPEPEPLVVDESSPFDAGSFRPVALHPIDKGRSRLWWLVPIGAVVLALVLLAWWAYPRYSAWIPWAWDAISASLARSEPTQEARTPVVLPTATRTATVALTWTPTVAAVPRTSTTPTMELTLTPTLTPSPSPSPTASPTPSPLVYTGIFLELYFVDTSWIQVTVDGVRQFQGELESGTYRSFYGDDRIELRVGNAGGVEVTLNGQNLGALGEIDEVVDRVFERVGDEVEEATVTPQSTGSPTAQATVAPLASSATARISPTISPTLTPTLTRTVTPTASP